MSALYVCLCFQFVAKFLLLTVTSADVLLTVLVSSQTWRERHAKLANSYAHRILISALALSMNDDSSEQRIGLLEGVRGDSLANNL